jgi:hypothetical protein
VLGSQQAVAAELSDLKLPLYRKAEKVKKIGEIEM